MELTWAGKLRKEGTELGRKEGLRLGRKEGAELGRQKELAATRRMLQLILVQRFERPEHELAGQLSRIDDLARLESISRRALADAQWDEIKKLLR